MTHTMLRARVTALLVPLLLASCWGGGGGSGGSDDSPAPAAKRFVVEGDLPFGQPAHPLLLDAYIPENADGNPLPAVVFIYGGGWITGNRSEEAGIAAELATDGYAAFVPDYRLADNPANLFPAQFVDVARAVRWIRAHAGQFGIDPSAVCVVGVSAGGHLANLLATAEGPVDDDPELAGISSRPACAVSIAGPSDLTAPFPEPLQGIIRQVFRNVALESASPISHIDAATAPLLLIHGTFDEYVPVEQSARFADALTAAQRPVQLELIVGGDHALNLPEEQQRIRDLILQFLGRYASQAAERTTK